jgi:hypothetical protein
MTDEMPRWVCEIGGYEMLNPSSVHAGADHLEAATQWLLRFGLRGHQPIHAPGLERDLRHYRGATHYGFMWWGPPREWEWTFPANVVQRLIADEQMREVTQQQVFAPVQQNRALQELRRKRRVKK